MSRGSAVELQIISFLGTVDINDSLFGFGRWKTEPVKALLSKNAVPFRVRCARTVAIPLLSAVRENLTKLEKNDVIEKVTHPTDWVSPMVPVVNSSLRIRLWKSGFVPIIVNSTNTYAGSYLKYLHLMML